MRRSSTAQPTWIPIPRPGFPDWRANFSKDSPSASSIRRRVSGFSTGSRAIRERSTHLSSALSIRTALAISSAKTRSTGNRSSSFFAGMHETKNARFGVRPFRRTTAKRGNGISLTFLSGLTNKSRLDATPLSPSSIVSLDWPFDNLRLLSEKFREMLFYVIRGQMHRLISTSFVLKHADRRALAVASIKPIVTHKPLGTLNDWHEFFAYLTVN